MSIRGWEELSCKCGGKDFVPVYHLQFQKGLGTSQRPDGFYCIGCNQKADQARMVTEANKREAERQIKDLEAQLGQ